MIRIADIGWAAGFLEGEGSFGNGYHSPVIVAGQKDREPIDKLQALFGGRISVRQQPSKSFGTGPFYMWRLNVYKSPGVMMMLYPLLTKRRQDKIKKLLEAWRAARDMRQRGSLICLRGHSLTGKNIKLVNGKYINCRECINVSRRLRRSLMSVKS